MADDRQKMTQGTEKSKLEDDNTNGLKNQNENELNDDPEDVSPEGLFMALRIILNWGRCF